MGPPKKKKFENEKFGQKPWGIREKAMGNSDKSNRNSGKSNNFCPKYMPPLSEFSQCFCPNFPIGFARIFHWFCPNFSLVLPEFLFLFPEIRAKAIGNSDFLDQNESLKELASSAQF